MVNSIIGQKLSVREVENMLKGMKNTQKTSAKKVQTQEEDAGLNFVELSNALKKLGIKTASSSKKITLEFHTQEEIEQLLNKLH
jgi:ParB family chromosome partitioning protein